MIELIKPCNLTNYIAVVPTVCVGNVGQLTSDLLISTLNLEKLGYIWHPQILPLCGAEPYEHTKNISTACEIFFSESHKLLVFQIRSALIKNSSGFVEEICKWLKENKVKQVIILAGISAHRRGDQQLIGEPLRYLFCPKTETEELENAVKRNWKELEVKDWKNDVTNYKTLCIPGSGIAAKCFCKLIKEDIPSSILFEFCSDGNNAPDALKLADYLDEWLQLRKKHNIQNWKIPFSWNLLFGTQTPAEIFN